MQITHSIYNALCAFCLILFTSYTSLKAQQTSWREKTLKAFIYNVQNLSEEQIEQAKIQLVTITPGITVTTAFGHSAIRVLLDKKFSSKDYYLDFGEYEPSFAFLLSLLKGNAKFYVNVIPMESAYNAWDSSGRGMVTSDIKLTFPQKQKFFSAVLKKIEESKQGYEYNNFTNNCVTFSRDMLSTAIGKPIHLKEVGEQNTWRKRVLPYSNQIIWLRINEKLLFDHDTDKIRNSSELIYLPLDLHDALKQNGLLTNEKVEIQDRWAKSSGSDITGLVGFLAFVFAILSQLPIRNIKSYALYGRYLFGFLSGMGGLIVLPVFLFTSFDFMDETIMFLVFTPLDFLFFKSIQKSKFWTGFLALRFIMVLIALGLRFTIYKQNIDTALFFSCIFIFSVIWNYYRENKTITTA